MKSITVGEKGGMTAMTYGAMGVVIGGALGYMFADVTNRKSFSNKFSKVGTYARNALKHVDTNGMYAGVADQIRVGRKKGKVIKRLGSKIGKLTRSRKKTKK